MSNSTEYQLHIEGKNGEKIISTYDSIEAVLADKALKELEVGRVVDGAFQFTPNPDRHAYFYAKSIIDGEEKFVFQNWGSSNSSPLSPPVPPAPAALSEKKKPSQGSCDPSFSAPAPPPPLPVDNEALKKELKQDKLISEKGTGELLIKEGKLYFNGELLADSYYRKYKQLLENNGVRFDVCFSYQVSGD